MAGVRIRNLSKSFGKIEVIKDISFNVSEGEFCVLLGPSGCGKSTVLRLIAGLEQQDQGEIFIGDREVTNLTPRERDIAMVFQSYALYPHMNVYENLAFSLRMKKTPIQKIDEKVKETAILLDIEELLGRKPKELSGGQKQRAAIGRAIVRNPKLFLFDEPLSNLDAKLRTAMRVELAGLHKRLGSTIIYVTHDQTEAMTLGHKIILLNNGRIQQVGTPEDVYERPSNLFAASFIGSPQINLIEGSLNSINGDLRFRAGEFEIDVSHRHELGKYEGMEVTAGIRPEALVPGSGPVKGVIEFVERLGSETILYLMAGGVTITARVPYDFNGRSGDEAVFSISERGMHFFVGDKRVDRVNT
ncbi:sn-glycerol-3-phosphate import ATP-binding protein UgpC [bacterium BMS3Abin07]|nr:sn-glycerol-3-phosphate import ATP-binding protein UgpC [bacterium BMS3Abin07]GBE32902.1 sn-glycerol-3-phosphate import ATP-binding protein UgpC [bacterium BMS3Bbin05]HDO23197.1 sn-glycerol-3-phosphate ABC transporter ATP-binding protein UgpC [Nitrospirota bacterium]